MKNRTKVLIITYVSAVFAVLAGFTFKYKLENDEYKRTAYYNQMQSMSQLADSMNEMAKALRLGVYSYSPETLTEASSMIWYESLNATAYLCAMPLYNQQLERTRSFINQAGDYAYYIANIASKGGKLSDEEREQLKSLSEKTDALSEMLYDTEQGLYAKTLTFDDNSEETAGIFEEFDNTLEEFTFIEYDGKLSENVLNRGIGNLRSAEKINSDTALDLAREYLKDDEAELIYESSGNIPSYVFADKSNNNIEITQNGGYVLSYYHSADFGEPRIMTSEAIETATRELISLGYANMLPVYYQIQGTDIQIEYVYAKNGVRYYPDCIDVTVSLYDGTVERINAAKYLVNHANRDENRIAEEITIPDYLENKENAVCVGYAIINSAGMNEILCSEILYKTDDGQEIVIYTDKNTNEQKLIKQVDKSDYGTFIV